MGSATLLLVVLLATQLDDKPIKIDPALLVGVWEQVRDAGEVPAGSTVEFTANGQYHARPKARNLSEYHSPYKVQGDEVTIESMNPGLVPAASIRVLELTATRLALQMDETREYRRKASGRLPGPSPGQRTVTTFNLGVPAPDPAPKAGGGRWAAVVAPEDGYRVEMPTPPTGESEEEGMGFSIRTRSLQTRSAEYVVLIAKAPSAIPQENRDKVLERMALKFAERFGSNVQITGVSPAQAGKVEGRGYTFTLDRPNSGSGSAMSRVFPLEKSAYALLVLPVGAAPIPEASARKFFDSFEMTPATEPNRAAVSTNRTRPETVDPRRRPSGMARQPGPSVLWGNEVNPDNDVDIKSSGPTMHLMIPGTPHLLAPERNLMNAPRVVMPVGGDFTVTVRVEGRFDPSDRSTTKGLASRESGGLIVWKDAANYLVFQRRASSGGDDGKDRNQAVLEELAGGSKGTTVRQATAAGPLYLRIDRTGHRIKAESSADGRRWVEVKPVDAAWLDGQVEVGVVAASNSATPHSVTFDQYKLMPR